MREIKTNEGKIAKIELSVCDQGHYGSKYCSLCGQFLLNISKTCPSCKATFEKTEVLPSFGGHDF